MRYTFTGRLQGSICAECSDPLSNVKVRLYRLRKEQDVVSLATVAAKETISVLAATDVESKKSSLLAEAQTDAQGRFVFELGEGDDYQGEAFELDVYCETVPGRKPSKTEYPPLQFTVTTLHLKWRDAEDGVAATWEYTLAPRIWCGIRARFGAWVICGQLTVCNTKIPVQGVRVRAFDVDWLQDDALGSAMTDATGRFRIDYVSEDFKQTPLSPWINWEMVGGPDLYFRVETSSGTPLLIEARSRGRDSDRENVGPCFCVQLCLDEQPETPGEHTYPLFTKVGQYRVTTDFTADGYTIAGGYAFTRTIPLRGILPDGADSTAMEYRFRVGKYSGGTLGTLSEVDPSMIAPTIIGQLEKWIWNGSFWQIDSEDYWVNKPGEPHNVTVKPGGWIEVPRENDLGSPFAPGVGKFIPNSWLIKLNTKKLVDESFDLTTAPAQEAGDSIPPASKSDVHTFSIVFEAREVGPHPISDTNALSKIVISNTEYTYDRHPGWAPSTPTEEAVCMLDIKEMVVAGSGCGTLNTELHALYTAYHPHADLVQLYFEGNAPLPPSFLPTLSGGEAVSGSAGQFFDITALAPCAYILWMRIDLNLTRGWGRIPDYRIWDKIAFCKA